MAVPLFNLAPDLKNSLQQSFRLLDEAFDAVPQRAETQGRSEEYVGRWIRERRISRDRIILATKVTGPSGQMTWIRDGPNCLDARNITEAIDNSLLRMRTDYIDLHQIHWPDRYVPMFGQTEYDPTRQFCSVPIDEQLDALGRAVDAGKIRYIGLSNETPYGVMKFLQLAKGVGGSPKIVSVQKRLNKVDITVSSSKLNLGIKEHLGLLDKGDAKLIISLLAYSPLAMGILSGKYFSRDGGPSHARMILFKGKYSEGESRYNLSNAIIKAATKEYIDIAEKYALPPVSLAIAFVLKHPLIASAIFGATKPWQLQEVLKACDINLTPEIIVEIDKVHARSSTWGLHRNVASDTNVLLLYGRLLY
ncbi:hypothetical protein HHK36_012522 [Tetracentron sinense]|uniref:NADP-dependent oxidoreductase domain-containing protein n=1 Tax=Tetracentron sinense TaxID=13715 RepID=A0A835DFK2_TETSI|nr:hypothetical protein HHK36_012522 [Tetracentron sinense]